MAEPTCGFRAGRVALVRAAAWPALPLPSCPGLEEHSNSGAAGQLAWVCAVWQLDEVAEAVQHASPALAAQVHAVGAGKKPRLSDLRRMASSLARYLTRAQSRATPFGLFAGVSTAVFGSRVRAEFAAEHTAVAHAGAQWLSAVMERLEGCPELLERLCVVVNNTVTSRGGRLIVPYQPDTDDDGTRAVEVSLAMTGPVRAVLAAARAPAPVGVLADKLLAEFPAAGHGTVHRLLQELVQRRVLITCLHAPSTETDALGHLLCQLESVDAETITPLAEVVRDLCAIRAGLAECAGRAERDRVAARMRALAPGLRRHPLALDLRLNAQVELPHEVAREIERAAVLLARLAARPRGTAAWGAYHQRFYERFGVGTLVPLQEAVADSGVGFPDGFPGAAAGERRPPLSGRDETLLRLAQAAVLDGREEVVLDEGLVGALEQASGQPRVPPHLEVGVRVHATSCEELRRGRFRLEIVSVSRGVGVSTGRFLSVLAPQDRAALAADLADLPTADDNTVAAQLSFPPLLSENTHVTRAPQVLPTVISLLEHRAPGDDVLTPRDLSVGCDGRRMYLAAPECGRRVEAVAMHALNLRSHTPPLARFLTELSRAQCAQVTVFDWGAAASLPYVPRLRYGRIVLAAARWRLEASELPARDVPHAAWDTAFAAWRVRRRLPQRVRLVEDDQHLALDLAEAGQRALLREHTNRAGSAVLTEAPDPEAFGWCGGRAHEVVVPLKATRPPRWPPLPDPTPARALDRAQMQTPAVSAALLATLYGDFRRQDALISQHLPDLLERLGQPPWWFIRFRDPDQHLRLRIALPSPDAFAETARTVSRWADELRGAGLLADVRYPTSYREMGRWGSGAAWDAAENVFRADSRAVQVQLAQPHRPHPRTLVAAHTVAIACAFLGNTQAGMRWLIDHIPPTAPAPVPRPQFTQAVRLADPRDNWAALRGETGGPAIVKAWADRAAALAAYRKHLPGPDTRGITPDDVLTSLLHVHFVRAVAVNFPEEAICLYLARAAAMAWVARTTGHTP